MKRVTIKKTCVIYFLIACVVMIPLTCGYIMDGGIIEEWIVRIDEIYASLQGGRLQLFPSDAAVASVGGQLHVMNSNLWFLLPALLAGWTGKPVFGWEVYMIFMQAVTLIASILMFKSLFENTTLKYSAFFGVLLYMTCPCHIYICYDLADMSQVAVWALLPLYLWAVLGIVKRRRLGLCLGVAALSLAGIGYANLLQMLVIAGLTLVTGLILRKFFLLLPVFAGSAITLPCLLRLCQYLFGGRFSSLDIPVASIMGRGYEFGEFFSIFVYREGHPGLGLGLLLSLLCGLWILFVRGGESKEGESDLFARKACVCFAVLAGVLLFMSLHFFPWEYAQRLGEWSLKLVSLFETPTIFFGMAQIAVCVSGAWAMGRMERREEKSVSAGMELMVIASCLGICIYQCNMLTYLRMPL